MIGADGADIEYALIYVRYTIIWGGIPTILATTVGHLIRAYGYPRQASFGLILGAIFNVGLDPLFMFVLLPPGNEVAGAALATTVSNSLSLLFFIFFIVRKRNEFMGSCRLQNKFELRIFKELIGGGLPAFCLVALAMLSNCFLNSMLSKLGNEAVAGVGVVRKIDHLAYAVNQGVTQGMLPLVAYSYSAGRKTFMKQIILLAAAGTELFSLISTTLSCIFASQLVAFFIKDPTTVGWGAQFLRVLSLAIPVYSLTFVIIAVFQAVGRSLEPLFISILHKGSLDILLLFIIRRNFGFEHIVWAAPVTEAVGLIFALILFWTRSKQFKVTN